MIPVGTHLQTKGQELKASDEQSSSAMSLEKCCPAVSDPEFHDASHSLNAAGVTLLVERDANGGFSPLMVPDDLKIEGFVKWLDHIT